MSRDRGSASVWLAGLAALIVLATMVAMVRGSAVLARHRAATWKTMAACGPTPACAAARRIAARNGGSLARCAMSGADVEVEVTRPVVLGSLGAWIASARARAGPVDRRAKPP